MADKIEDAGAGLWEPVRPAEPTRREPRASAPEPSSDSVPSDVRSLFVAPVDSGRSSKSPARRPVHPPLRRRRRPQRLRYQVPRLRSSSIRQRSQARSTASSRPRLRCRCRPTNLRIVEGRFRIHELAFRSLFRIRSLFRTCSLFRIRSPARRRIHPRDRSSNRRHLFRPASIRLIPRFGSSVIPALRRCRTATPSRMVRPCRWPRRRRHLLALRCRNPDSPRLRTVASSPLSR